MKLEEAVKKVRGVAQLEATDYTAYLFPESQTDIDQESEEKSTPDASTEIDSSSISQYELEQGDSDDKSPAISQEDLEQESSGEESPLHHKTKRRRRRSTHASPS
uniref:Uncharacterized protein n=1 Tax=Cannabis sativa TaxID=3483 RepID=A0A803NLL2_CANSA